MRSLIGSWIFENLNKNLGNHRHLDRGCLSGADASFSLTPLDSVTVEHGYRGCVLKPLWVTLGPELQMAVTVLRVTRTGGEQKGGARLRVWPCKPLLSRMESWVFVAVF